MMSLLKFVLLSSILSVSLTTSTYSDLSTIKYIEAFGTFLDYNKDGVMDKKDMETFIFYLAKARGWESCDVRYKQLQDDWLNLWSLMVHQINNQGHKVTIEDWIRSWRNFAKDPAIAQKWQRGMEQLCFEYLDEDHDGYITREEFLPVFVYFERSGFEVSKAFDIVSEGKKMVSRSHYHEQWKEYFVSDDPHAPGNSVTGKIFA